MKKGYRSCVYWCKRDLILCDDTASEREFIPTELDFDFSRSIEKAWKRGRVKASVFFFSFFAFRWIRIAARGTVYDCVETRQLDVSRRKHFSSRKQNVLRAWKSRSSDSISRRRFFQLGCPNIHDDASCAWAIRSGSFANIVWYCGYRGCKIYLYIRTLIFQLKKKLIGILIRCTSLISSCNINTSWFFILRFDRRIVNMMFLMPGNVKSCHGKVEFNLCYNISHTCATHWLRTVVHESIRTPSETG